MRWLFISLILELMKHRHQFIASNSGPWIKPSPQVLLENAYPFIDVVSVAALELQQQT